MASADVFNPSTVTTTINYFDPPSNGVRAYQNTFADPITGERKGNYKTVTHKMIIENVRGKEDEYSLDKTGFQWLHAPTKVKSFQSDEEVAKDYYPEAIEYYKKFTGANKVVIFDHTIRRNTPGQPQGDLRQPVAQAHVDQSVKAATARVYRHVPEEADELLKKRFQIINLWRPISHPAEDWPLALCDYRSVDTEKDVVPVSLVYPDREGETLGVKHNPDHKWKYLKGMTPDQIVLIKCSDSIQDGSVAVFTPHTAFPDPTTPPDAPLRESIEIRALVFYD